MVSKPHTRWDQQILFSFSQSWFRKIDLKWWNIWNSGWYINISDCFLDTQSHQKRIIGNFLWLKLFWAFDLTSAMIYFRSKTRDDIMTTKSELNYNPFISLETELFGHWNKATMWYFVSRNRTCDIAIIAYGLWTLAPFTARC